MLVTIIIELFLGTPAIFNGEQEVMKAKKKMNNAAYLIGTYLNN
jgi:hypothetical protein